MPVFVALVCSVVMTSAAGPVQVCSPVPVARPAVNGAQ